MKGMILAGGLGTRLYPATRSISKQLLPVYDKPMIYYPLCTLMQAGIQDILIITTLHDLSLFQHLLGDGSQFGISLSYIGQANPEGIAQAFIIGEAFIGNDNVALILGDNIFYGDQLSQKLQKAAQKKSGATIFSYYVADPERYGVVAFNEKNEPTHIIEKPTTPPSHYAVVGLYFYDNTVIDVAKSLTPSLRGELEITDVSAHYLRAKTLHIETLSRGTAWLDTGTHQSLLEAANFISILEQRQGLKIGSPEEMAWRMGYISKTQLKTLAQTQIKSGYGKYLLNLLEHS